MTGLGPIAVMGEALVDLVPEASVGGQSAQAAGPVPSRAVPGGSGLNTALALARLAVPTHYLGSLSDDAEGADLKAFMQHEGIVVEGAQISARPCPRVIVTTDADGVPLYDLRLAGTALDEAPAIWPLPQDLVHLHATSFASLTGVQGTAAMRSLQQARGRASTSFDPNLRAAALPPKHEWASLLAARIAQADLVKASAEDLDVLARATGSHTAGPSAILREWRDLGAKFIIVTKGAAGATAFFGDTEISVASPSVLVRDTVGAGDTFMGALLALMHEEAALGMAFNLPEAETLERWLRFATRAAALTCTRAGADPPARHALQP